MTIGNAILLLSVEYLVTIECESLKTLIWHCQCTGILRRQQLRAGCWFRKSVLQFKSLEGRWPKSGSSIVSACSGSRKQWKGRVGVQGTKANDKNQLQTGMHNYA